MSVATATFAFDKKSARSFDADGRMRVVGCTISTSEVNPYYGKEIPGREKLGLDANSVYDLHRCPVELSKAADSFNGLPLMIRHVAQTANDPRKHDQAGSVYNARFDADRGQLIADLLVTDAKAIELIESEVLADLSSSYRYTPDMTPGEIGGKSFHGTMRGIQGNHVALVEDGRATGAHVADSALSSQTGATTVENENTPDVAQALLLLTEKFDKFEERLAKLEAAESAESDVEVATVAAEDSDEDDKDKKAEDSDKDSDDKDDKPAMDAKTVQSVVDAAVKAERERLAGIDAAKRATRGDLGDMIAMDSAGDIYRAALSKRGVDVKGMSDDTAKGAYQAIQAVIAPARRADYANDAAKPKAHTFNLSNIRVRG